MIEVYGSSDDLVEVEGDIREEFQYGSNDDGDGDILGFSDGTILRIQYTNEGIWRITRLRTGTATLEVVPAVDSDSDNYSDRATLDGEIAWVVHGGAWAHAK